MSEHMSEQERRNRALAAAHSATEAAGALLLYAREGASYPLPFGEIEAVEKLADAAKMALEVEFDEVEEAGEHVSAEDAQMRNQFLGACERFLDGHVPL